MILPSCKKNKAQAYFSIAKEYSILLYSDRVEHNQETIEKIIYYYKKALEMEPTNPNIYATFADFLIHEKEYDRGTKVFQKAFELKPKEPLFHNYYAWFLATCEDKNYFDPKKALHHAQLAVKYYKEQEEEKLYSDMKAQPGNLDTLARAYFMNIFLLEEDETEKAKFFINKAYETELEAIEMAKSIKINKKGLDYFYSQMDKYLKALKEIEKKEKQ